MIDSQEYTLPRTIYDHIQFNAKLLRHKSRNYIPGTIISIPHRCHVTLKNSRKDRRRLLQFSQACIGAFVASNAPSPAIFDTDSWESSGGNSRGGGAGDRNGACAIASYLTNIIRRQIRRSQAPVHAEGVSNNVSEDILAVVNDLRQLRC